MGGVHSGLDLETNALKAESTGRRLPSTSLCPPGDGASRTRLSGSWFTPKLSAAEVNRTGVVSPEGFLVVIPVVGGEQFAFFERVDPVDAGSVLGAPERCAPQGLPWRRRPCG